MRNRRPYRGRDEPEDESPYSSSSSDGEEEVAGRAAVRSRAGRTAAAALAAVAVPASSASRHSASAAKYARDVAMRASEGKRLPEYAASFERVVSEFYARGGMYGIHWAPNVSRSNLELEPPSGYTIDLAADAPVCASVFHNQSMFTGMAAVCLDGKFPLLDEVLRGSASRDADFEGIRSMLVEKNSDYSQNSFVGIYKSSESVPSLGGKWVDTHWVVVQSGDAAHSRSFYAELERAEERGIELARAERAGKRIKDSEREAVSVKNMFLGESGRAVFMATHEARMGILTAFLRTCAVAGGASQDAASRAIKITKTRVAAENVTNIMAPSHNNPKVVRYYAGTTAPKGAMLFAENPEAGCHIFTSTNSALSSCGKIAPVPVGKDIPYSLGDSNAQLASWVMGMPMNTGRITIADGSSRFRPRDAEFRYQEASLGRPADSRDIRLRPVCVVGNLTGTKQQ